MKATDTIHVTLTIEQWRDAYRILNRDRTPPKDEPLPDELRPKINPIWNVQLNKVEEACKRNQLTIPLTVAQTWPMAATIRRTNQALADAIREQLSIAIAVSF